MLLTCTAFESPSSITAFRTYPYASNLKPRLCRLTRAAALAYNVLRAQVVVCLYHHVFLLGGLRCRILTEPAHLPQHQETCFSYSPVLFLFEDCESAFWLSQLSSVLPPLTFFSVLPSLDLSVHVRTAHPHSERVSSFVVCFHH